MERNKKNINIKKYSPYIIFSLVIFFDQLIKYIVQSRASPGFFIAPNFLKISYLENYGIAFGISINQFFLYLLIFVFLAAIILFCKKFLLNKPGASLALSIIIGGAISNVIDRIIFGFIRDVFELYFFSRFASGLIFNLADIFIVLGITIIVINYFKKF